MIKKRKLGNTDLFVSEIGLGCYQLGGSSKINDIPIAFGDMDEKSATNMINEAIELGINTFDTADFYSLGKSESRLGNAVKQHRNKIHIQQRQVVLLCNTSHHLNQYFVHEGLM